MQSTKSTRRSLFGELLGPIGRCRRQGQLVDEVEVELYQYTDEMIDAFRKARDFARFIEQTEGTPQKLCFASYDSLAGTTVTES